ncbi:MAG: hypothetical protein KAX69_08855, partial [Chitinophagales bacterium]|nr:hypothetical protein [Chitinophagales bacterium]
QIPVNDFFEIHPSKLKITKPETEEERLVRLQKEAAWKQKYEAEKAQRKTARKEKEAAWKEELLKRRYKENYIPKEQRSTTDGTQTTPTVVTMEEVSSEINTMEVELDAANISKMADDLAASETINIEPVKDETADNT